MFDKLAEDLRKARIKKDLTLKQLSVKTRIDIKFLEAMEEGNFSFLPELYVKAFIKEYANVVGMNVEITLKKYEAAKEGLPYDDIVENITAEDLNEPVNPVEQKNIEDKNVSEKKRERTEDAKKEIHSVPKLSAVPERPAPIFDSTVHPAGEPKSGNKNTYLLGAVIGGIIILFGLIYLIFFRSGNEIIVPEKPYDQVISESRQRYEEKPGTVADSSKNSAAASDSLNLVIQTSDTSWVKIIFDNSKEEEFILFPNSQKSLVARNNYKITFGRSSAIKLMLNGKPLVFSPKSKSVSYIMISSKGLEYLQSPPAKGNE